ncbi:hypothetical protein [Marinobacterium sp. MBR-109]|jgi:hypothetical protein|uniref:hypothetical protein n=1 Tax=Marinobacterium sp. MBR-109 TaxID=3156462 RepID=UPI00339B9948
MEPQVDTHHSPRTLSLRALLSVALILLLSLSLGGVLEYLRSSDLARQQANEVGLMFGRSSAILIQPLVLADDRISLNFLFTELAAQPLVSGLRLTAPDQTLIALAGQPQGRGHSLDLVQGDEVIGQLTYWTNPAPFEQLLHRQLMETGLLLGGSLLLTALLLGMSLRRQPATAPVEAKPDFREFARELTPAAARDTIPAFSFDDMDTEPETRSPTAAAPQDTRFAPSRPSPEPASAQSDTEAEVEPSSVQQDDAPPPDIAVESPSLKPDPEPEPEPEAAYPFNDRREPRFDTDELVSLLKPERDERRMPSFIPQVPQITDLADDSDEAMVPDTDEMELEEHTAEEEEYTPLRPNPLKLGNEEQLGLYSFEHELELMLTPDEAGYLLLIDTRSAHSDNVEDDERNALLKNYRTLANSVARIYSGSIEPMSDGNLRVLFTNADDKDSHGVNALCCAMLFTHLYKQYNQSQIRAFQPVMNLHMALVRGARDRIERMQEEAHFLTRTTQSNELISHTALTEAPLLKESLLQKADIRREDEDKVLILSVSESYQALLEKQARHLLSKLNERQQGSQSSQPTS